jgi:hypothetical protein
MEVAIDNASHMALGRLLTGFSFLISRGTAPLHLPAHPDTPADRASMRGPLLRNRVKISWTFGPKHLMLRVWLRSPRWRGSVAKLTNLFLRDALASALLGIGR